MKKLALISVSDKIGIVEFATSLNSFGYHILATGNTAKLLLENSIDCTLVEDYTDFPEIFSGRVKTLQPKIFGGILMRPDNKNDLSEAAKNDIEQIDIVCVNLYPFPKVVNRNDIDTEAKIENIDIGGPSLIRAAAKNYKNVSVLTNPNQYDEFIAELELGDISENTRQELAYAAFAHTSYYDTLIANYFEDEFDFPKTDLRINYKLQKKLRYGENPHQQAFIYGNFYNYFEVLHGKELSYNNIIDLSAAAELVGELENTACAVIKHTNPCGAAISDNVYDAYEKALSGDPVSAFGGIVVFNKEVDKITAEKLNKIFLEIILAPSFSGEAFDILKKKKNRRLVKQIAEIPKSELLVKSIPGGLAVQEKDSSSISELKIELVSGKNIAEDEMKNLKFAWIICKHTKSNAIVFVKDMKVIGVGAGQMSRVDSARIAAQKAIQHGHKLNGAVAASDAFFPFADGLIEIAEQGITSVIQPGGSVRDKEVIEAANNNNIAMVFTGVRNFKH